MRLKPEKIELLARKTAETLQAHKRCELLVSPEMVAGAVRRIITEDLRREDDLEKEAEEILKTHRMAIDRNNMSYNTLMSRTKQELAKRRKIIL